MGGFLVDTHKPLSAKSRIWDLLLLVRSPRLPYSRCVLLWRRGSENKKKKEKKKKTSTVEPGEQKKDPC